MEDKYRQPCPDRVELPIVAEIPQIHQPRTALAKHRDHITRVEGDPAAGDIRTRSDEGKSQYSSGKSNDHGNQQYRAPGQLDQATDQVRQRGPQSQSS